MMRLTLLSRYLLAGLTLSCFGQTCGEITGVVTDWSGAVVAGGTGWDRQQIFEASAATEPGWRNASLQKRRDRNLYSREQRSKKWQRKACIKNRSPGE